MEFMERDAIVYAMDFIGEEPVPLGPDEQAHLLIEVDGNDLDALMLDCEKIVGVVEQFECGEVLFAEDQAKEGSAVEIAQKSG